MSPAEREPTGAPPRTRLDRFLVDTGRARSRGDAAALVREGRVRVGGQVARRAGLPVVPDGAAVTVERDQRWVGRGAGKLLHALTVWGSVSADTVQSPVRALEVRGRCCLDVGASTGGFTQVLLAHGAAHVTAVDVGHGQLAEPVRADRRVRELSGTNIRHVAPGDLGERFGIVVADLSFISLRTVLAHLRDQLADDGDLVVLVKPQFEAGRETVRRGQGVVRQAADRHRAVWGVLDAAAGLDLGARGLERAPGTGTHGNVEYLLWLTAPGPGMMTRQDLETRVDQLAREE